MLPKFNVAAFVPALPRATPAASLLNTMLMELCSVAFTASVPLAVVCAADRIGIASAPARKIVISFAFVIVFLSLLPQGECVFWIARALICCHCEIHRVADSSRRCGIWDGQRQG